MSEGQKQIGGIVLCGGQSRRMGTPKHLLEVAGKTSLERVVQTLRKIVSPIVVVGSPDQQLPELPSDVITVFDEIAFEGPLAGLLTGMKALQGHAEACFFCGCDSPLLRTEFVEMLIDQLEPEDDAIVPEDTQYLYPLSSVIRMKCAPIAQRLFDEGERRARALMYHCQAQRLSVETLQQVDPLLDSLRNMNSQEDYEAIQKRIAHEACE